MKAKANSGVPIVALVGNPNCGKSALFNRLTGARQKVGNYPGVTVERREGVATLPDGREFRILDLPGTYSLRGTSPDEKITREVVLGNMQDKPDVVVCVCDTTNLNLHLKLALELKEIGIPVLIALNMIDIAKNQGFEVSPDKISELIGLPVVTSVAVRKHGADNLLAGLSDVLTDPGDNHNTASSIWVEPDAKKMKLLQQQVEKILQQSNYKMGGIHTSEGIDRFLLHPVLGILVLLGLLFTVFQAVFSWSALPMDLIDAGMIWLGNSISALLPDGYLKSLIVDGIIAGVGSVIIFLPQILILFFFILLLEETGYMARAAYLLDGIMGRVGLHGRAFIPLLSSFACAIPGVMAARTITNPKDRLVTILAAPLMTCSARIPVYTLIIAAFIPASSVYGFNLQGLVMFGLYAAGLISGLLIAYLAKKTVFKGIKEPFLMELPAYKMPSIMNLALGLKERAGIFLKRAGTIIFFLMIIIWVVSTFPGAPADASEPAINYSFAGMLGHALEPIFAPIGFNWQAVIALIPGMAAREVAVAALGTVYALSDSGADGAQQSLQEALAANWSFASAMAFLAWYVFAPQCVATIAVVKRETNSWKWALGMTIAYFMLAYLAALIVYNVFL